MSDENCTLAEERISGQPEWSIFSLSTPTIENYGINDKYKQSTQQHYFFNCPHCNRLTELIFPECLVITAEVISDPKLRDSHIICKECKTTITQEEKKVALNKGQWVASAQSSIEGYHINQLYSLMAAPWQLAQLYLRAQVNPTDEQEFYNSKLGLTHAVKGAKISDALFDSCIGGHKTQEQGKGFVVMGVDVGTWLHYEITQYYWSANTPVADINLLTKAKVLRADKCEKFEELDHLIQQYSVVAVVIDNQPETRSALDLANRFPGRVWLCIYGQGVTGKNINEHTSEPKVTVDRTSWLDLSLGRFKSRTISLPLDISLEYRQHVKAPTRVYKKDGNGNPVGSYQTGKEADHFAHARNYSEIALAMGAKILSNRNIRI
jgi:hypothetical protein